MKQIYVSDETHKLIKNLPRGSKTKIIDHILKSFLNEVVNRATLNDLKEENFPIFFDNMLKEICKELKEKENEDNS